MKNIKTLLIFFFLLAWHFATAQVSLGDYALTGAIIVDADHRTAGAPQTILITDNKISDVFADGSKPIPASFSIIRLNGKYVLPGLIDAHVHMATDPSGVDNRAHTLDVLQRMLYSGVTTVRDMAGDARILAGLSRDALTGDLISPDIYYSALMAGPVFFSDPRSATSTRGGAPGHMPFMLAVTDSTNLELAIAEAKGTGATGIKLYANLPASLVDKIVVAANKQNMIVWGHAWLQDAKPTDVVKAGVSPISHVPMLLHDHLDSIPAAWKKMPHDAKFWDKATPDCSALFQLMKQHHTILDATLLTYKKWADQDPAMRYDYELGKRMAIQAYKAGVMIDAGTDDDQEEFVQKEMELLVKDAGLSAIDAIIAGTLNGAKALRIDNTCGTVAVNKMANLLIIDKNPLDDIKNIETVDMVIKRGRIFRQ